MNENAVQEWTRRVGLPEAVGSVPELLELMAERYPSKRFLADHHGDAVTYAEALQRTKCLAEGFAGLGVGRGDVVVLYMGNSVDMVMSMLALGRLGAAGAPINTEYKGDLLTYVVNDTRARIALVDSDLLPVFVSPRNSFQHLSSAAGGTIVVRGELAESTDDFVSFEQVSSAVPREGLVATDPSTLFMVNYTSGTTGPSKGVLFPNGQVLTFAHDWTKCMGSTSNDVLYSPMPLFHTLGFVLGVISTLLKGGTMQLDRRFSASQYWTRSIECGATIGHAVFSMIPFLLKQPPSEFDRAHSIRRIWTGPSGYAKDFYQRFGVQIYEVHGQSEIGVAAYPVDWDQVPEGSCGQPNLDRFELRIVDNFEAPVGPNTPGELLVRPREPHTTMLGYLGKPEKTAEVFANLWHHTGDQMFVNEDGWYFFVDRAKDMIRRRSQNISAYDIELVINKHPAVMEVAAIAVPSEHQDDEIKVCIVVDPEGQFDFHEFIDFCRDALPRAMVPRYVELVDAIPKTANEKLAKYKLKEYGILGMTGKTFDVEGDHYVAG
ncbi:AMP-binding protein [Rhodococcus opacus]